MMTNESDRASWPGVGFPMLDGTAFLSRRGRAVFTRPLAAGDTGLIADFLSNLSARSLFLRYCMPMPRLAPELVEREVTRLGQAAMARQLVTVALDRGQGADQVIALAELVPDERLGTVAEIALVVADAYQREGIGGALCAYLITAARRHGITTVRAISLVENKAVRRLIAKSGAPYTAEARQGMMTIEIDLAGQTHAGEPFRQGLRTAQPACV